MIGFQPMRPGESTGLTNERGALPTDFGGLLADFCQIFLVRGIASTCRPFFCKKCRRKDEQLGSVDDGRAAFCHAEYSFFMRGDVFAAAMKTATLQCLPRIPRGPSPLAT